MSPEIVLVPSSVTLVPGATGRADVAGARRGAVVGALVETLDAARRRGAGHGSASRSRVEVTLVAPAPIVGSRRTDHGVPDLGALGMADTVSPTGSVRLHVAASVVTVLLRLAGWRDAIHTVEIGAAPLRADPDEPAETAPTAWPAGALRIDAGESDVVDVVVFTTVGARDVDVVPIHAVPGTGQLATAPAGLSDLLSRADRAVDRLYRDTVLGTLVT